VTDRVWRSCRREPNVRGGNSDERGDIGLSANGDSDPLRLPVKREVADERREAIKLAIRKLTTIEATVVASLAGLWGNEPQPCCSTTGSVYPSPPQNCQN
jgi:hypothetical protein